MSSLIRIVVSASIGYVGSTSAEFAGGGVLSSGRVRSKIPTTGPRPIESNKSTDGVMRSRVADTRPHGSTAWSGLLRPHRARRRAHDRARFQCSVLRSIHVVVGNHPEQDQGRLDALLVGRHIDGGQERAGARGKLQVAESDDAQVIGEAQPGCPAATMNAVGHQVGHDQGRRRPQPLLPGALEGDPPGVRSLLAPFQGSRTAPRPPPVWSSFDLPPDAARAVSNEPRRAAASDARLPARHRNTRREHGCR